MTSKEMKVGLASVIAVLAISVGSTQVYGAGGLPAVIEEINLQFQGFSDVVAGMQTQVMDLQGNQTQIESDLVDVQSQIIAQQTIITQIQDSTKPEIIRWSTELYGNYLSADNEYYFTSEPSNFGHLWGTTAKMNQWTSVISGTQGTITTIAISQDAPIGSMTWKLYVNGVQVDNFDTVNELKHIENGLSFPVIETDEIAISVTPNGSNIQDSFPRVALIIE